MVLNGKLPFKEYDAEPLLKEALKKGNLSITDSYDALKEKLCCCLHRYTNR